jgi:TFIIF-interacting CTD phosphatase-like protein
MAQSDEQNPQTKERHMSKSKPEEPSSEPVLYEVGLDPNLFSRLEDYAKLYALDIEAVIITAIEEYLEK